MNRLKKIIKVFRHMANAILNIDNKISVILEKNNLEELSFSSCQSLLNNKRNNIIVSVTTYKERINDVHLVIESLGRQTIKPEKIILWLDESEFKLSDIPLVIKNQIDRGLEVRFCYDYKSYKKIIPTLKDFPTYNVITVDDDIIYPRDMIEILYRESKQFSGVIIGHRAHKITYNKGKRKPYCKWELETNYSNTSLNDVFITTGGGTLFPAGCFNDEFFNSEVFLDICPHADDIWINSMAILNGVKRKKTKDTRRFSDRFYVIDTNQDMALFHHNLAGGNDVQIENVYKKYNI